MAAERWLDSKPASQFASIPHLLADQATRSPGALAILAPGRAPLTYGRLYQHIGKMVCTLREMGIGPRDRIAVILPNGPEMAAAVLTVASSATCAPMNPGYGAQELDRYFADLQPRALILQAGIDSPARRVALSHGMRVIELSSTEAEAGLFTLAEDHEGAPADELASGSDVALLLLTSGTTSRPKIVPLTHTNICASAYCSVAAVALSEMDRCINMLPLFHGHGLINILIASLAAGASVVCTSGCDASSFFAWLSVFGATWYSAVPTMHQAILAQARHQGVQARDFRLRFVRSASAPLSPRILEELERTFDSPVIESYGMTETASSPIACNPLPPRRRKPGSVGIPVGLDVAIMDKRGAMIPDGQPGQVVVRGASVMASYWGDTIATSAAFSGDWFKTGDLGFLDEDGYLFLVGRIREIINRGGEKISPHEVEEVLLKHPAVAEAVTFAVPHATLGEDVAAAVVLRPNSVATSSAIRQFAKGSIADFKIPRQVLIVAAVPKGPTGKVKRVGLAAKLGLVNGIATRPTFVAPRTPIERGLAKIWVEVLRVEQVGIHDDFFVLGGDSLLVTHVILRVFEKMHFEFEVSQFFEGPTIAEMGHHLEKRSEKGQERQYLSAIVPALRRDRVPTSIAQERLWKVQQALRGMPFLNILYVFRLTGVLDLAVLERCFNEIVRRHAILRTTFAQVDGRCVQVIAPPFTMTLTLDDLRALSKPQMEAAAQQILQGELLSTFDLERGPLFRVRLVGTGNQEHLLVFSTHQVITDGWSRGVLVNELTILYDAFASGEESPLTPLALQFADFACWQQSWQSHPDVVAQLAYWREQLRGPLPPMDLARTRVRRTNNALRMARREWSLPVTLVRAVNGLSHQEGGTLFMALVAALKMLLHRYLERDDVRVATLVANRNRPGTDGLIGPLANTLILRTSLGGDPSPQEVMRRVRATTFSAYAHQGFPFEELAETLERERGSKGEALASVMIILHNATLRPTMRSTRKLTFADANAAMPVPLVMITSYSLVFALHENARDLRGYCWYKSHIFSAKSIDRLLGNYRVILEHMVTQPDRPISTIRISRDPEGRIHNARLGWPLVPSGRRQL